MKKFIILIAILNWVFTNAQTDSAGKSKQNFKLSMNYNSAMNYYGRTDSLKSTGVFPLAEFWFSKDLYVSVAPVFVNNKSQSLNYAGTVATLGFLHVTDKWITNLYLLKPFYKKSSQLVQSALKAQTGINLSYLNKLVNITGGGDIKFSDKTDFGATAGIDHIVRKRLKDNSVIVIDPSFYIYGGTQNFSKSYLNKNPGFLLFPGSSEVTNKNVQQFNVLAYEFSIPVIYAKGKWMALVTPSYILPRNLITVPNRPDLSERGQNIFYATIALKYSF